MRPTLLLAAVPLALAACQQAPTDPDPETSETALPVEVTPTPSTVPVPTPTPSASDTSGIPEGGIPVAVQGNWGLVPADCTSTRGDNKGLLRVTATTLQFYESLGRLGTIKSRSDNALRADFTFSGEGMTWTRDEMLSVAGNKLTRTERGGDEPGSGGPFTYTRC
jgi:hypothetical protein